jgi:hypothetical protein
VTAERVGGVDDSGAQVPAGVVAVTAADEATVRELAAADPSLATLCAEVTALRVAFPGAVLLAEPLLAGRRLVQLPRLLLGPGWTPRPVAGLLDCTGWPNTRPVLRLHESIRRDEAAPVTVAADYVVGSSWLQFSFNCPYSPDHCSLVPVVRGWLRRFDGRS